jgi:hypothetical protein
VVRATVDVNVEVRVVVVAWAVETAAATGAVCTAGALFAGATGGVATFGAAGTGGALGAVGAGAAGSVLAADDCVAVASGAAAAGGATADCVAVATAGAAGVLGTPARATSTKAAEQARTPANRTGRIRRLLTRVNTRGLLSARRVV